MRQSPKTRPGKRQPTGAGREAVEAVVDHEDGEDSEADAAEEVEEVSERDHEKSMDSPLDWGNLRVRPATLYRI
jgi:hypothetical protein